jgi:hypothetical protein
MPNVGNRLAYISECKQKVAELFNKKKVLVQYIYKGGDSPSTWREAMQKGEKPNRGRKVGVVVAVKDGSKVSYGWSKCNLTAENFNRYMGIVKALSRLTTLEEISSDNTLPSLVRDQLPLLLDRTKRYYKDVYKT